MYMYICIYGGGDLAVSGRVDQPSGSPVGIYAWLYVAIHIYMQLITTTSLLRLA